MKIKPLQDQVAIKRCKTEAALPSGILLPGSAKEKNQGEVIAVGPSTFGNSGWWNESAICVRVGQAVVFKSDAGENIVIDGEEYIVMPERDVLAVVAP